MLRFLTSSKLAKYFLATVGLLLAIFFGFNAYSVGEWFGQTFLQIPGGAQIFGVVLFAAMFSLVLMAIFQKENLKLTAKAHSKKMGDKWFIVSHFAFFLLVIGFELVSVLYRASSLTNSTQQRVVLYAGLVGMGLVFVVAKLLHAEMKRNPATATEDLRDEAGRQIAVDGEKRLKDMTIEQKRRVAAGDTAVFDEVRDASYQEREAEVARMRAQKQAEEDGRTKRQQSEEERERKNQQMYDDMIYGSSGRSSSNGKRPF